MSLETLQSIIARHHIKNNNLMGSKRNNTIDIAFEVQKELFVLNRDEHLSQESKIFVECRNSSSHIYNIIEKIFVGFESVPKIIGEELQLINKDQEKEFDLDPLNSSLLHTEERLKQALFRRTGQLHGHLSHIESSSEINGIVKEQSEMLKVLYDKISYLERANENIREDLSLLPITFKESISEATVALVPRILKNNLDQSLDSLYKRLISEIKKHKHELKQEHGFAVKSDIKTLPIKVFPAVPAQTNPEDDRFI